MLLFLVLLALAFYAFLGLAPKEVVQLGLAGMWALMILGTIASIVVSLLP